MSGLRKEELRLAIRELLAEEIARLGGGAETPAAGPREERVSLRDDAELAAFVRRLATLCADAGVRADLEAGRVRFRLAGAAPTASAAAAAAGEEAVRFDVRLVSEREVNRLGRGTRRVLVAKKTRFTPLAKDALRRRGITIERSES